LVENILLSNQLLIDPGHRCRYVRFPRGGVIMVAPVVVHNAPDHRVDVSFGLFEEPLEALPSALCLPFSLLLAVAFLYLRRFCT
jgi:hypothetical protein